MAHHLEHQPKSKEFLKSLGDFFKRDLISMPLVKKYPHTMVARNCGRRLATLEFDTSAYPNIEYIAGDRLSVYPANPADHVSFIMKHLIDDVGPSKPMSPLLSVTSSDEHQQARKKSKSSSVQNNWARFVQLNGKDSLRLALIHLYDITTAPSRDLLRIMAENCSNKEHKAKLISLSKTDELWETWICSGLRNIKTTFEEFSSCKMSAKTLLSELILQQPRQYSLSSIKASKRFRTEIIVVGHQFSTTDISKNLQNIKEHDNLSMAANIKSSKSPASGIKHVNYVPQPSGSSLRLISTSLRSLRMADFDSASPISSQQVRRVPDYSGPLISLYAGSTLEGAESTKSSNSLRGAKSSVRSLLVQSNLDAANRQSAASSGKLFEGLCSNYLLGMGQNEHVICEFVENPRFTLKGNRERPIMMIGQDVGMFAYRAFWQQRAVEQDRAQLFYTLFKDLSPKKFGDMQLVCVTGNRCKLEDLFKREISNNLRSKVLSSAVSVNRDHLLALLDSAATSSQASGTSSSLGAANATDRHSTRLPIESRELLELGQRMAKLLVENNGCLYTCCDPQMTQALEILAVESVSKLGGLPRKKVMALLPKWKGRKSGETNLRQPQKPSTPEGSASNSNSFLFTLENPFERAQIVQEIYDPSV